MRQLAIGLLSLFTLSVVACKTVPNPDFCCVTQAQCDELGGPEIRPCRAGQACEGGRCIASQCDTSADCTDPSNPVCILNLCVAKCVTDDDCTGAPGAPYCASDGACVGCTVSSQCPASAAICDVEDRTCRGCEADDQCASGVCIEAEGTCAADSSVIYLTSSGTDNATCTRSAPCQTIGVAVGKLTGTRNVIRILSGTFSFGTTPVPILVPAVIDGSGTVLDGPSPFFTTAPAAAVIMFEGVRINSPNANPIFRVDSASTLRLFDVTLDRGEVKADNGTLELVRTTYRNGLVTCTNGTTTLRGTVMDLADIRFTNCQLRVSQSRMSSLDHAIQGTGGLLVVENNVFTTSSEFVDMVSVGANAPGSAFRFNTMVNTSSIVMSPVAIYCESTLDVTSNIIAYNSTNPIHNAGCVAHDSLFDLPGKTDADEGTTNQALDPAAFFKDRTGGDFHIATGSPAHGKGQPGLVTADFDGRPRPQPAGSRPDVGAFEAP